MRSSLLPVGPPVSRDRVITTFPKWYTPDACLQMKEHFHGQVSAACQRRNTGTVGLRLSKVVVVGDLYVGKTSLIHRFCKNVFDRDYKATIGVDFEIERFEIAGVPYSLQIWDTAGQEKFKCIASAYYRGAQVIITAFDLSDVQTLEHSRQWLEDALRENEAGCCFVFLVGTKKDLLSGAACQQAEAEAVHLANELQAEYWSVSAKTGENVKAFFSRVAALAFEQSVLQDLERRPGARPQAWREARPSPGTSRGPPARAAASWGPAPLGRAFHGGRGPGSSARSPRLPQGALGSAASLAGTQYCPAGEGTAGTSPERPAPLRGHPTVTHGLTSNSGRPHQPAPPAHGRHSSPAWRSSGDSLAGPHHPSYHSVPGSWASSELACEGKPGNGPPGGFLVCKTLGSGPHRARSSAENIQGPWAAPPLTDNPQDRSPGPALQVSGPGWAEQATPTLPPSLIPRSWWRCPALPSWCPLSPPLQSPSGLLVSRGLCDLSVCHWRTLRSRGPSPWTAALG